MKPTQFMRIPFFVTGYQVTPENMAAVAKWCQGHIVEADVPFIRVPVDRPTNRKQTEAYPGNWVIVSLQRGNRSFKVYGDEWLRKQFFEMPDEPVDEGIADKDLVPRDGSGNPHASNARTFPTQQRPRGSHVTTR